MNQFVGREAYLYRRFKSGCEGKRAYRDHGHALRAREIMIRKAPRAKRNSIEGTDAYQCQFCGKWHLGHSDL